MKRRLLLPAALIALAACGRDTVTASSTSEPAAPGTAAPATVPASTGAPGTPAPGTAAPGTGAPATGAIAHPTGADEAIVRLSLGGGFAPEGADFQRPPDLLILGDGTVIRPGPQIEIFPPPLLPALTVAKLDEEGIQTVLKAADDAGLIAAPPAYDIPPGAGQVTDAPGTTLEIHAGGQDLTHTAYALGIGPDGATESTSARHKLNDAVTELRDLSSLVGAHLDAEQQYEPTRFGVISRPATPEELAPPEEGPAPATVPWPDGAGNLADGAGTCVEVAPDAVRDAFTPANQTTRFTQAGVTYVVYVRVLLPDESCAQFA
jgi:hypothetical protein